MYELSIPSQNISEAVVKLQIFTRYELFATSCDVSVVLRDADDHVVRSFDLVMDQDHLDKWTDDDNHVVNWVVSELGLKL